MACRDVWPVPPAMGRGWAHAVHIGAALASLEWVVP